MGKSKFNIENVKNKIGEINQRLEDKKQEANDLQKKYQALEFLQMKMIK